MNSSGQGISVTGLLGAADAASSADFKSAVTAPNEPSKSSKNNEFSKIMSSEQQRRQAPADGAASAASPPAAGTDEAGVAVDTAAVQPFSPTADGKALPATGPVLPLQQGAAGDSSDASGDAAYAMWPPGLVIRSVTPVNSPTAPVAGSAEGAPLVATVSPTAVSDSPQQAPGADPSVAATPASPSAPPVAGGVADTAPVAGSGQAANDGTAPTGSAQQSDRQALAAAVAAATAGSGRGGPATPAADAGHARAADRVETGTIGVAPGAPVNAPLAAIGKAVADGSRVRADTPRALPGVRAEATGSTDSAATVTSHFSSAAQRADGPAAASPSAHLMASVDTTRPAWSDQVMQKVMWMSAQNINKADIALDPPELGPLHVRVTTQGDQMTVSFASAHAVVRDAVDQGLPRLRDMLENQGLDLVDVDVAEQNPRQFSQGSGDDGLADTGDGALTDAPGAESQSAQVDRAASTTVATGTVAVGLVDHYV